MTKGRRLAIIVLFLTTALIGAGAIYIGNRLSNQPEITPDDASAAIGDDCVNTTPNPTSATQPGSVVKKGIGEECCGGGTLECNTDFCAKARTGPDALVPAEDNVTGVCLLPPGTGSCNVPCVGGSGASYAFQTCPDSFCADGIGSCADAAIQLGCYRTGGGGGGAPAQCSTGRYVRFDCPNDFSGNNCTQNRTTEGIDSFDDFITPYCGSQQIDCDSNLPGDGFVGKIDRSGCNVTPPVTTPPGGGGGETTPTPTATPTPPSEPFDIQILATCQDGSGPIYSVGGAQIIIGQGAGNSELTTVLNDNGAYTTTQYTTGPFVGHVRIGGAGTISLKERTNYPNGNVVRTVDISELTKITPVTGNSTGSAPQCNSSGNNAAGQCTCGGQYEVCNFHSDGANSSGRFFFEFKFSNCLGTTEVTPTATPVPGELSCGNVCVPGTSICAAGTVCSNVEGTYRCALQTCIDNPGSCADICSFEKLPQTALVSDKADRIILAMIMVLMGALVIRYGFSERLGDLFWNMGGKYILSKVHPTYARELKVETKKKMLSKQKKERRKFEKGF